MKKRPLSPPRPELVERISSIRLSVADQQLILALQKKTGTRSGADILRQGIRALARELGI